MQKIIGHGHNSLVINSKDPDWVVKYNKSFIPNSIQKQIKPNLKKFIEKWKSLIKDLESIRIIEELPIIIYQFSYLVSIVIIKMLDYSSIPINIKIPQVKNFNYKLPHLLYQYEIQKIKSPKKELLIIDLINPKRYEKKSGIGIYCGYEILLQKQYLSLTKNFSTLEMLIQEVGKLYSYLHFVINIDGYGCKLVLGKINNENTLILHDFDQVTSFDFKDDAPILRKIGKDQVISYNELETLLFTAMLNSLVIPNGKLYHKLFLTSYKIYVDFNNKTQLKLYNLIYQKLIKHDF